MYFKDLYKKLEEDENFLNRELREFDLFKRSQDYQEMKIQAKLGKEKAFKRIESLRKYLKKCSKSNFLLNEERIKKFINLEVDGGTDFRKIKHSYRRVIEILFRF